MNVAILKLYAVPIDFRNQPNFRRAVAVNDDRGATGEAVDARRGRGRLCVDFGTLARETGEVLAARAREFDEITFSP